MKNRNQADPLSRVTGPRMNPSVDVGRPPRPFRHLRMTEHRAPDPSSSRAPVHSALVQISVTRHHQPCRPTFSLDARQILGTWQVQDRNKVVNSWHPACNQSNAAFTRKACPRQLNHDLRRLIGEDIEVMDRAYCCGAKYPLRART
jgi:hypothetical protein